MNEQQMNLIMKIVHEQLSDYLSEALAGEIVAGIAEGLNDSMTSLYALDALGAGWISSADRLPENQETVLAVKELKSGQRQIGLAYCIREYEKKNYLTGETTVEPYWVCGGNNNIIYWMPLPRLPE